MQAMSIKAKKTKGFHNNQRNKIQIKKASKNKKVKKTMNNKVHQLNVSKYINIENNKVQIQIISTRDKKIENIKNHKIMKIN
jgi:hypothetical protein